MEDLKYYLAMVVVIVVGIIVIKKISSCIWNIIVGAIILAVLAWALVELGTI